MRSRLPSLPPFVITGLTVAVVVMLLFLTLGPLLGVVAYLAIAVGLGLWDHLRGNHVDWVSNVIWPFLLGVWIDEVADSGEGSD